MRPLFASALTSATLTLVTAVAVRAAEPALTIAAIAAAVVLLSWYAQLGSDDDQSSLDATSPAVATTLAVVGRRPWGTILPCWTAHVVGAVAAGFAALALDSHLPAPLAYDADSLVAAAVAGVLAGLIGAWATLAVDGGGPIALTAAPVTLAGILPLGLVGAFSPAVVAGLATAELLPWDVAGVAAAAGLASAAVGAWLASVIVPANQE